MIMADPATCAKRSEAERFGRVRRLRRAEHRDGRQPIRGCHRPIPAHVGKHGEVFGRFFEAKENPLGDVRIARKGDSSELISCRPMLQTRTSCAE